VARLLRLCKRGECHCDLGGDRQKRVCFTEVPTGFPAKVAVRMMEVPLSLPDY